MQDSDLRRRHFLLLALVAVLWGAGWPIMKLALEEITPLWFAEIRFGTGALSLVIVARCRGVRWTPCAADLPVLLSGALIMMVGFTLCIAFALTVMPAGRCVVIAYTFPLWVFPVATLLLGERFEPAAAVGTLLGVSGVLLLLGPWEVDWGNHDVRLGVGALIGASLCWAVYILHMRARPLRTDALVIATWQMTLAAAVLLPFALIIDGPPRLDDLGILLEMTYVGPIATGLCFWGVLTLGQRLPAVTVSSGLLAVPVVGVALSVALFDEQFAFPANLGVPTVLAGLLAVTLRPSARRGLSAPVEANDAGAERAAATVK